MEKFKSFLNSRTFAALTALISGLLTLLSDYPNPIAVLAWIAPVPVLVVALRRGFPDAAWLGLLYVAPAYFGSGVLTMPGFVPLPIRIGYFLAYIALFEFIFVATVYLVRRTDVASAGWVHAVVVTVAGLVQEVPYIGHFLPAASTQAYCGMARSIASLGGDYLVAFAIYLFSGSLAALLLERRRAVVVSGIAGILMVIVFMIAGRVNVASYESRGQVRVAAVVHNYTDEMSRRVWHENIDRIRSSDTWQMFGLYERSTRKAASEGARVVSWPEYALWVRGEDLEEFTLRVERLARETGAAIAVGYVDVRNSTNCVLLVGPGGEKLVYVKYHLAPGSETSWQRQGERPFGILYVASLGMKIAVRICADNDFSTGNRLAALEGANVFIAPSADSANMAERHAMAHVMRAAENGIPMIRATLGGISLIAGPDGGIISQAQNQEPGGVGYVIANIPLVSPLPLYVRWGNWITVVSGLMLLVFLVACTCCRGRRVIPDSV